MTSSTIEPTEALEALPAVPARRAPGPRERVAAHALAADIARLHGDALLRTAKRWTDCADDAYDAYQRALELLLANSATIDRGKALAWMQVVVRREAHNVRRAHDRTVALEDSSDEELDEAMARLSTSADERLHSIDLARRAGEALAGLKESQAQALCLRAQGLSYEEIGEAYGWSYRQVNRAITEGRRAFVNHYQAVEGGEVCDDTAALVTRYVAGDLSPAKTLKVRAHLIRCPACRALLHAERQADLGLQALLPPVLAAVAGSRNGWIADHLLAPLGHLAGRLQPAADHLITGKFAAVAASTLAVAGGGLAVERQVAGPPKPPKLRTALSAAPVPSTGTTKAALAGAATDPAGVMTTAVDRSHAIAAAKERRAAAARRRAAAARKRAAIAQEAKHEFSPAKGEFAASGKRTSARASRAATSNGEGGAAPATVVPADDGAPDSTVAVAPDQPSSSAPSSDAVSDEFGP